MHLAFEFFVLGYIQLSYLLIYKRKNDKQLFKVHIYCDLLVSLLVSKKSAVVSNRPVSYKTDIMFSKILKYTLDV